ncbi:MAG: hypothetical protein JSU61_05185 [Fidelibacterota bacterium]|nr:MAG: hypothetical protein JSU61_05185 [Candidatus Neomarinimicrobiota bacterium]
MSRLKTIIVASLGILCCSLFLGACEDNNASKRHGDPALIGTWDIIEMSWITPSDTTTYIETQLNGMGAVWTLVLRADGTLEQVSNMSGSGTLDTQTGTWSTSDGQLTITLTFPAAAASTLVYEYAVDGELLTLSRASPMGDMIIRADFRKQ